jgi:hypothetical protein
MNPQVRNSKSLFSKTSKKKLLSFKPFVKSGVKVQINFIVLIANVQQNAKLFN